MIRVDIVTQSFNLSIVGQTAQNRSDADNLQGGNKKLKRSNRLAANKLSYYYFCNKNFPVVKATRWPSRSMPVEKEASVDFPQNGAFRSDSYPPSTAFYYLSIHPVYAKLELKRKKNRIKCTPPMICLGNRNETTIPYKRVGKQGDRYPFADSIRIDCDAQSEMNEP